MRTCRGSAVLWTGSMSDRGRITEREFWDRIIQGLLILLGAIEEYLGKERSVTPKHKRERQDNG